TVRGNRDAVDRLGIARGDAADLLHRLDHPAHVHRLRIGALEDLLGAARGLADRRADLLERVRDRVDVLAALADHDARLAHALRDLVGVRLDLVDQLRDLLGAAARALRVFVYCYGDHREA